MPLYELKSARDLEIAIARKLPLRVSCCGGIGCYADKEYILENIQSNYNDPDDMEEDRYWSEQPLIGKILKRLPL